MTNHMSLTVDGCRRLTVLLPASVWSAVRSEAQRAGRSMNWVMVHTLREHFALDDTPQSDEEAQRVQEALDKTET
jgi:hypothetical protein